MGLLDILNEVMRAKGPRQQNMPGNFSSLVPQEDAGGLLGRAATMSAPVPVLGDVMGLLNDAQMYRTKPEERTPGNFALTALGALPFVPAMAGTFAGVGAKTADVAALGKAQEMTKAGADPVEVWKATGWTDQFPDKKWRFEIPDNAATIKGDPLPTTPINGRNYESWNVGAVTQHDPLFAAYPQLKSIEQSFQTTGGGTYHEGGGGWISLGDEYKQGLLGQAQKAAIAEATAKVDKFSRSPRVNRYNETLDGLFDQEFKPKVSEDEFNAIHKKLGGPRIDRVRDKLLKEERDIRQAAANNPTGGNALAPEAKSVQFHELQHAVQGEENFARGGNAEAFALNIERFVPEIAALKSKVEVIAENSQGRLGELYRKAYYGGGLNWKESGEFEQLKKALPEYKAMREAEDAFRQGRSNYDLYKSLAGEAEARLTQSRIPLTAAERRARPPWQEFDVPPEQQIVRGLLGQ